MNILTKLIEHIKILFVKPASTADVVFGPSAVEYAFCRLFGELRCRYTIHTLTCVNAVSLATWTELPLSSYKVEIMEAMKSRALSHLTVDIEDRAYTYLAMVSDRMSVAMMFLTYVQYWACQHRCKIITFELLRDKIFEHGFPSGRDLGCLWYAQKIERLPGGSDNLIDYKEAQKSIQF